MIKIVREITDKVTCQKYKIGEVIDLGNERNNEAVNRSLAVWVDSREFQAEKVEEKPKAKRQKKNIEVK